MGTTTTDVYWYTNHVSSIHAHSSTPTTASGSGHPPLQVGRHARTAAASWQHSALFPVLWLHLRSQTLLDTTGMILLQLFGTSICCNKDVHTSSLQQRSFQCCSVWPGHLRTVCKTAASPSCAPAPQSSSQCFVCTRRHSLRYGCRCTLARTCL